MTGTDSGTRHATDGNARSAILRHHAELAWELDERVEQVLSAVRERGDHDQARRDLLAFLSADVLPHAAAEERTLYPAAQRDERAELLVQAMIAEHRTLTGLVARLEAVTEPIAVAETAARISTLFSVHVSKENEYLLLALARARVDLADLLHDTHHLLAGAPHDAG